MSARDDGSPPTNNRSLSNAEAPCDTNVLNNNLRSKDWCWNAVSGVLTVTYIVIAGGVVAENGTHAELLAKQGIYANLYKTQFDTGEKATVS